MARPRRDVGPDAVERMTEAFWCMLAEMRYEDIKVVQLAARANMSPNTLYYHFDGVADLARNALASELDSQLAREVLAGGEAALTDARTRRYSRVSLAARSGSAELTGMLASSLRALWLSEAGVSEDDLTDEERQDLAFAFGGLVAMLADRSLALGPGAMASFRGRPLGRGLAEMLMRLAIKDE